MADAGAAPAEAPASRLDRLIDRLDAVVPPFAAWAFAFRIWFAMVIALCIAFWLQLDSASSAATCVAILAQPKRGQAISKAIFRVVGTLIGIVMSILAMALFGQDRVLLLVSFTVWLAICVFIAQYLQDTRAYAAVLSGYTVAIIALGQINTPQDTFDAAVARLAAITVGILTITFINDALGSPTTWRGLLPQLADTVTAVRDLALEALTRGDPGFERSTALLGQIVPLGADTHAIETEFDDGPFRAAGARSCIAALYVMTLASGVIARATVNLGARSPAVEEAVAICRRVAAAPEPEAVERDDARLRELVDAAIRDGDRSLHEIVVLQRALDFVCAAHFVDDGLRALADGHTPLRDVELPKHSEFALTLRNTVRVVIGFGLGAAILVAGGQPQGSIALIQLGALAALSALAPDPKSFATGAIYGMVLAATFAGIDRFLVLQTTPGYPLLAISMALPVFLGCFLSLKPKTFGIGFILLVYFPVLLGPSNPQTYDFQSFLTEVLFSIMSTLILAAIVSIVLPTSNAMKRTFALGSARRALADALVGSGGSATTRTALNVDRLRQFAGYASASGAVRRAELVHAFALARLEAAAARAHGELRLLWAVATMRPGISGAREALARGDAAALADTARLLVRTAADEPPAARMATARLASDLATAAVVIGGHRRFLRRLDIAPF